MRPWLTIVGVGEDGLEALGRQAHEAVSSARMLFGGERHLAMVPEQAGQERHPWPAPFSAAYEALLARRGEPVCVLASGDPMFFGVGASLAKLLPVAEMQVFPAPSSVSLAAARLGWPLQELQVVPAHGRPLERVCLYLAPGARLLVLSADGDTPRQLAELLVARGYGDSELTLFERLGGPGEQRQSATASAWTARDGAALNLVAVHCHPSAGTRALSRRGALPDDAFEHDGQITKRDVRAATLARLAPLPGELLWDVGAGSGSIGIEWMRADDGCHAIAIEPNAERRAFIEHNRANLGVPGLELIAGCAPDALQDLERPDAIFIGGGLTVEGVPERCWDALKPGGRLVANAVTIQTEALLVALRERIGGELTRLSVAHASPLGRFDGWRTAMPVTILTAVKPASAEV